MVRISANIFINANFVSFRFRRRCFGHFLEGLQPFPDAPRSAFSLHTGLPDSATLPADCPSLTSFTFDVADTPEMEYPVMVALGFNSPEDKAAVYADMARRMAGQTVLCGIDTSTLFTDPPATDPTDAPTVPSTDAPVSPTAAPDASPTKAPTSGATFPMIGLATFLVMTIGQMLS